ncbi:hypothetical protein CCACVL1_18580 [Corchorus capsularis]|uniref:Uncharacterized protein n=1 Tax=Corchorus capsularis TaxID=210143 RepID=A0A1R3HKQ3_COCAP|nr:hypothetical protein CCACVL1_18580 [Corchorus capsularis]
MGSTPRLEEAKNLMEMSICFFLALFGGLALIIQLQVSN